MNPEEENPCQPCSYHHVVTLVVPSKILQICVCHQRCFWLVHDLPSKSGLDELSLYPTTALDGLTPLLIDPDVWL